MNINEKNSLTDSVSKFRLPRYHEIPDVGLYLEQTVKYIGEYLSPLYDVNLTGSMISNYVKKKLVDNPVKKQYGREQIAYIIFIAIAKSVLSLDNIQRLIGMQKKIYSGDVAYDYFCLEFENILQYVFGLKVESDTIGIDSSELKLLLRNIIITAAHKIYLDTCFGLIRDNPETCE